MWLPAVGGVQGAKHACMCMIFHSIFLIGYLMCFHPIHPFDQHLDVAAVTGRWKMLQVFSSRS
jgi:hypothetical protein